MRVLLLGAGASRCAGYPLASELVAELQREAETTSRRFWNFANAWKTWEASVKRTRGQLRLLLLSPNPEVVLSVPDLCDAAWNAELARNFMEAGRAFRGEIDSRQAAKRARRRALNARKFQYLIVARERFRECLNLYFRFKLFEDSKPENRSRRDYLRELLRPLNVGDVVVTLNWDTTVERTLLEDGRWNPRDGYGFTPNLLRNRRARLPRSEVTVLKLHGSVGWHRTQSKKLYFDSRHGYLRSLAIATKNGELQFRDPTEQGVIGPPRDTLLAYPSFLKQLAGKEMQEVWTKAIKALLVADSVEVWGYSLPESDLAVRSILAPLRFRLSSRQVEVSVHDPNGDVRSRWREFLGKRAKIDSTPLGPAC